MDDDRFASIANDPRFKKPSRGKNKVPIDKRFQDVLKDKDFTQGPRVDKYGRKTQGGKAAEEAKRLYKLSKEDEDESESPGPESSESPGPESETQEEEVSSQDIDAERPQEDISGEEEEEKFDPARGEGLVDTSDDEESDDDEALLDEVEARELAEPDQGPEVPRGDATSRLAIVNLDWDNINAMDVLAVVSSFAPPSGIVRKVTIYPSEFGQERLKQEALEGPPKEIFLNRPSASNDDKEDENEPDSEEEKQEENVDGDGGSDEDVQVNAKDFLQQDEGEDFDMAKLRQYQLERLRYYYAIVDCDSVGTAQAIYNVCDGAEFETSANFFDLRFVPEDMAFDAEPKDACKYMSNDYAPNDFVTDALQHSKVKLTWDEDDPRRRKVTRKQFSAKEIEELDFQAYLASSDSEDEDQQAERSARQQRYKELLSSNPQESNPFYDEKSGQNGDMQITFAPGLDENASQKEQQLENAEESTLEKYKRKERERKERRKEMRKSKMNGGQQDTTESKEQQDLGFDDPFFSEKGVSKSTKKEEPKLSEEDKKAKQAQKAELELLMMQDEQQDRDNEVQEHFDMRQIMKAEKAKKRKGGKRQDPEAKEGTQSNFELDVSDPRFSALYESHHFAIDPTNPNYKKTQAMEKVMNEKRKRAKTESEGAVSGQRKDRDRSKGSVAHTTIAPAHHDDTGRLVKKFKSKRTLSLRSAAPDPEREFKWTRVTGDRENE